MRWAGDTGFEEVVVLSLHCCACVLQMQHEEQACCRLGALQSEAGVSLDAVDDVVLVSQAGAGVIKAQLRPVLAVEECPRPDAHHLMVSAHSCVVAHVLWCRLFARVQT